MKWFSSFIEWTSAAAQAGHASEVHIQCCQFCNPHSESIATSSPFLLFYMETIKVQSVKLFDLSLNFHEMQGQNKGQLHFTGKAFIKQFIAYEGAFIPHCLKWPWFTTATSQKNMIIFQKLDFVA